MAVQKLPKVGNSSGFSGMHSSVQGMEVRDTPVGGGDGKEHVEDWGIAQIGLERKTSIGPEVTEKDLNTGSEEAGRGGVEGVMPELLHGWVDGVEFVFVELILERREVEKPVPEAADDPGCHEVSSQDWPHPVPRKCCSGTKSRVLCPIKARQIENANPCEAKVPGGCCHGSEMTSYIQEGGGNILGGLFIRRCLSCLEDVSNWPDQGYIEGSPGASHIDYVSKIGIYCKFI